MQTFWDPKIHQVVCGLIQNEGHKKKSLLFWASPKHIFSILHTQNCILEDKMMIKKNETEPAFLFQGEDPKDFVSVVMRRIRGSPTYNHSSVRNKGNDLMTLS